MIKMWLLSIISDSSQVINAYGPRALGAIILIGIVGYLLYVLVDRDRSDKFRSKIYKILFAVSNKHDHEKKYISHDIRGQLNSARRKLHFGYEPLPKAIDIEWADDVNANTFDIKENQFVVRLDNSKHQAQNIALLAGAVVSRTTLVGLRHILEEPLQTAIDITLTRKLLHELNKGHVLDWFLSNDYKQFIAKSEIHKMRGKQVNELDEKGLFTRILLLELDDFAKKMRGKEPKPYMAGEIEGFISFLNSIATKKPRIDVSLTYLKAFLRVGVVIVADTDKILGSIDNYVKAVHYNLHNQSRSIYFLVYDKEYLSELSGSAYEQFNLQVNALSEEIAKNTILHKYFDLNYYIIDAYGNRRRARCIRYIGPDIYDN